MYDPDDDVRPDTPQAGEDLQRGVAQVDGAQLVGLLRMSHALPVDMRPLRAVTSPLRAPVNSASRRPAAACGPTFPARSAAAMPSATLAISASSRKHSTLHLR
jgi:hypothetical protein